MSFESDLLAWAQRQISLPPLRGLPPDQQRKLLHRLLVGAILPRLEAIRPGSAEDPEIREAIRIIPELVVPENEFVLERGLVIVQQASLSIHVGTNLNLEWQGPAPAYSWSNIKHPQGELSISAVTCPGLDLAPTWTGAEFLGAQGEYTSRATQEQISAWRMEGVRSSTRYTGLLRLLVEGWGPHENFRKLQPAGWPSWTTSEMGYRGVIRVRDDTAQTYRWYLIYLGPTLGCRAVELTPDPSVSCLVDELYGGSLTPQEWIITEAWVLRKLALDPATQEIFLITPQEYAQDVIGFSWMHGWKFCHQYPNTILQNVAEANIVVLEYEEGTGNEAWYNTRHCKVSFLFTGTLTASLSLVAQEKFYPDSGDVHHPLWEETDTGLEVRMMPRDGALFPDAPSDLSDIAPVYCIGYDDQQVNIARYHKKTITLVPGQPTYGGSALAVCAGGEVASESWYNNDTLTIDGGWSANGLDANFPLISGSTVQFVKNFRIEFAGAIIDVPVRPDYCNQCPSIPGFSDQTNALNRFFGRFCEGDTDRYNNEEFATIVPMFDDTPLRGVAKLQGGDGYLTLDQRTYPSNTYGGHSLIIPKEDAESVIILSAHIGYDQDRQAANGNEVTSRHVDSFQCDTNLPAYVYNAGEFLGCYGQLSYGGLINGEESCILGAFWPAVWNSCFSNDPAAVCASVSTWQTIEITTVEDRAEPRLISGSQKILLDETFDKWKDYIAADYLTPSRPWNPVIKTQYGGAAIYQEKPELTDIEGIKSNAGFDTQALADGVDFRFVSS